MKQLHFTCGHSQDLPTPLPLLLQGQPESKFNIPLVCPTCDVPGPQTFEEYLNVCFQMACDGVEPFDWGSRNPHPEEKIWHAEFQHAWINDHGRLIASGHTPDGIAIGWVNDWLRFNGINPDKPGAMPDHVLNMYVMFRELAEKHHWKFQPIMLEGRKT